MLFRRFLIRPVIFIVETQLSGSDHRALFLLKKALHSPGSIKEAASAPTAAVFHPGFVPSLPKKAIHPSPKPQNPKVGHTCISSLCFSDDNGWLNDPASFYVHGPSFFRKPLFPKSRLRRSDSPHRRSKSSWKVEATFQELSHYSFQPRRYEVRVGAAFSRIDEGSAACRRHFTGRLNMPQSSGPDHGHPPSIPFPVPPQPEASAPPPPKPHARKRWKNR